MTVPAQRPMSNSHRCRRAVVLLAAVTVLVGVEAAASAPRGHLRHPRRRQQQQPQPVPTVVVPCKQLVGETCQRETRCRWRSRKGKCVKRAQRAQEQGGVAQVACRAGADGLGAGCGGSMYCKLAAGACAALAPAELGDGKCVGTGVACADKDAPVCGCDGADYANQCQARAAGISIGSWGACPPPAEVVEAPLVPTQAACRADADGFSADDCGRGNFCQLAAGACAGLATSQMAGGRCEAKVELCPNYLDPVCGCDGETYDNQCKASASGMSVAERGRCAAPGRPSPDAQAVLCVVGVDGRSVGGACGEGEFCELDAKTCAGLATAKVAGGKCRAKPEMCTRNIDPVCGCDADTYANACTARAKGMSVAFEGRCVEPPKTMPTLPTTTATAKPPREPDQPDTQVVACAAGANGRSEDDCGKGRSCRLAPGACRALLAAEKEGGLCEATPFMCTEEWEPVCGCDGETYDNQCKASASGMSVAGRGRCAKEQETEGLQQHEEEEEEEVEEEEELEVHSDCEVASNGRDDSSCSKEQFCRLEAGACSNLALAEKGRGRCVIAAGICPMHIQPVCGCNDVTYSNTCKAGAARISIAHEGACDSKETEDGGAGSDPEPNISDIIEGPSSGSKDDVCVSGARCSAAGSVCTEGKETCCGETYDSFRCDCQDMGGGNLMYMCFFTDACAFRQCPEVKEERHVEQHVDQGVDWNTIVEGSSSGSKNDVCAPGSKCGAKGSVCTSGQETCCGETHDSLHCDCEDMGDGSLIYMCVTTDACNRPCAQGKQEEPPVDAYFGQAVDWDTCLDEDQCFVDGTCTDVAACDGDPCAVARCGEGASCEVDRCDGCRATCIREASAVAVDTELATYYPPV